MIDVDLNLLRVFDTLYELRSVTKAGVRLGLTQSAVSHALSRLRQAIDDPLFVRAPGGLQPTARAVEIAAGVREGLIQLRGALSPKEFDPATASRRFTIAAGSYFCSLLVPDLMSQARRAASDVSFQVVPLESDLLSQLDESVVDLALGSFTKIPPRLVRRFLFREDLVWIAAADNPVARATVDRARIAAQPRLTISTGKPFEALKALIAEGGLERRVIAEADEGSGADGSEGGVIVYDALTASAIVGQTDFVALVPRRFAQRDARRHGFVILELPDDSSGIDLSMLWHGKFDEDAGLAWLRDLIVTIAGQF